MLFLKIRDNPIITKINGKISFHINLKSNSIFGGVSNNKKCNVDDNSYTIYINASCMFGGVEIK